MWNSVCRLSQLAYNFKTCKICLVGANGSVGRHLALNLKLNKHVTHLTLYDRSSTAGIREDLSHIDTTCRVNDFSGDEKALIDAITCSNIVVITAAKSHSAKLDTREAMFDANAELLLKFMKAIDRACHCNMPFIHVVTNPVNSLLPLCAEYLKELGSYNPRKIIGSTSVDSMRARTFLGQLLNYDPSKLIVPVVGGHSDNSITPLLTLTEPRFHLSAVQQQQLAERIKYGADEVINATNSSEVPYLAMGHCVAKFCDSICRAIYGEKNVMEVGYVPADINELEFFACNFSLNNEGIKECHRLPLMSSYEAKLYYKAVADVKENIQMAKKFFKKYKSENLN